MSNGSGSDEVQRLRQQLSVRTEQAPTPEEVEQAARQDAPNAVAQKAEAAYWRQRYERSRLRLGKLWVAYKDLEAELEMRKEELDVMAEQKAASLLNEEGRGDLLAIAAPDGFEVVSEVPEREIEPGGGTSFPIVLTNRTDEPMTFELEAGEVDAGWQLLLTLEELELEPKASQTVHVIVRSRAKVEPGDVGVARVLARAGTGEPRELELRTRVVEPGSQAARVDGPEAASQGSSVAGDGLSEEVVVEDPSQQTGSPGVPDEIDRLDQAIARIEERLEGRAIRIDDPDVDKDAEPFEHDGVGLHCAVIQQADVDDTSSYAFFFADKQPEDAFAIALPGGYEVLEDEETGIPYLSPLSDDADAGAGGHEVEHDAEDGSDEAP